MKVMPLIGAGLALGLIAARWRRLSRGKRALAAVAAAALAVYGSGAIGPPNLEKLVRELGATLGPWTYVLVGVAAFAESGAAAGLIAPGEAAVIVGGVTAGQGQTDLAILIPLVWACALAGDTVAFMLGRRLGRGFILRHGPKVGLPFARVEQLERFFSRHGGKTILIGRFIGFVRVFAPFVAGASRMPARRFFMYAFLAAGAWSAVFTLLGYLFWHSFDAAASVAKQGTLAVIGVAAVGAAGVVAYRRLRSTEEWARVRAWARAHLDRTAFGRALLRRFGGRARATSIQPVDRTNGEGRRGRHVTVAARKERRMARGSLADASHRS
jgi:membrane protein DedA with SNARE-associated domain